MSVNSSSLIYDDAVSFSKYQSELSPGLPTSLSSAWNGWVVARAKYLDSSLTSLLSVIKNIVRTVYDVLIAATAGLGFTNQSLRNRAVNSVAVTSNDLLNTLKSLLGVLWPFFAKKIEDWLDSVQGSQVPNQNKPANSPVSEV